MSIFKSLKCDFENNAINMDWNDTVNYSTDKNFGVMTIQKKPFLKPKLHSETQLPCQHTASPLDSLYSQKKHNGGIITNNIRQWKQRTWEQILSRKYTTWRCWGIEQWKHNVCNGGKCSTGRRWSWKVVKCCAWNPISSNSVTIVQTLRAGGTCREGDWWVGGKWDLLESLLHKSRNGWRDQC